MTRRTGRCPSRPLLASRSVLLPRILLALPRLRDVCRGQSLDPPSSVPQLLPPDNLALSHGSEKHESLFAFPVKTPFLSPDSSIHCILDPSAGLCDRLPKGSVAAAQTLGQAGGCVHRMTPGAAPTQSPSYPHPSPTHRADRRFLSVLPDRPTFLRLGRWLPVALPRSCNAFASSAQCPKGSEGRLSPC